MEIEKLFLFLYMKLYKILFLGILIYTIYYLIKKYPSKFFPSHTQLLTIDEVDNEEQYEDEYYYESNENSNQSMINELKKYKKDVKRIYWIHKYIYLLTILLLCFFVLYTAILICRDLN